MEDSFDIDNCNPSRPVFGVFVALGKGVLVLAGTLVAVACAVGVFDGVAVIVKVGTEVFVLVGTLVAVG